MTKENQEQQRKFQGQQRKPKDSKGNSRTPKDFLIKKWISTKLRKV